MKKFHSQEENSIVARKIYISVKYDFFCLEKLSEKIIELICGRNIELCLSIKHLKIV
jgi:hypothetical protein